MLVLDLFALRSISSSLGTLFSIAGVLTPCRLCISQAPCHLASDCAGLMGNDDERFGGERRQGVFSFHSVFNNFSSNGCSCLPDSSSHKINLPYFLIPWVVNLATEIWFYCSSLCPSSLRVFMAFCCCWSLGCLTIPSLLLNNFKQSFSCLNISRKKAVTTHLFQTLLSKYPKTG